MLRPKHLWLRTATTLIALSLVLLIPAGTRAAFIFQTGNPPGTSTSSGDGPLNGEADFTVGSGTISIVLKNLQTGMTSQGQALSSISFQLSPGSISSLTSVAGKVVAVDSSGNVTSTGSIDVKQGNKTITYQLGSQTYSGSTLSGSNWDVTSNPSGLTALSGGQPNHMILGPASGSGTYPGVTGGFDNFNPFFQGSATFVLNTPEVTDKTTISNVVFNFGTGSNEHPVTGTQVSPFIVGAPAPPSVFLLGLGSIGFAGLVIRSRLRQLVAAV
jgi:hypothetical protein